MLFFIFWFSLLVKGSLDGPGNVKGDANTADDNKNWREEAESEEKPFDLNDFLIWFKEGSVLSDKVEIKEGLKILNALY
jgi:hypothetical protein